MSVFLGDGNVFNIFVLQVLVENGTKEGHQMLMEARDTLVKVLQFSN